VRVSFVHDVGYTCRDVAPDLNDLGVGTDFILLSPFRRLMADIRKSTADIIHANYIRTPAYASFASFKRPYVLHAHGDDIRYGLSLRQRLCVRFAARTLYSTNDMAGIIKNSIHVPQPVDTNRFFPIEKRRKNALYFVLVTSDSRLRWHENEYIVQMKTLCNEAGIELSLTPKVINGIPYEKMPEYLSGFEYFFDREYPQSHSKTALECMAMKIPVVSFDMPKDSSCFKTAEGLVQERYTKTLNENSTRMVAKLLKENYEQILG